ncbi:MAG: 2-hydroxyacyl-CoA dehydratase family protein, partial [Chloroflexota bacterium]
RTYIGRSNQAMEEILQEFTAISEDPYKWLSDWKKANNRKLVAVYPLHVPEEVIHAAGALPFIIQRTNELITLSQQWLQSYFCDFSRSTLDLILKGKLDFVDGIVLGDTCFVNRGLPHIFQKRSPQFYQYNIFLPKPLNKTSAQDMLREQLKKYRAAMEKFSGAPIGDAGLWKSIEAYNENRSLIRQIYALRRSAPGTIKAREMQAIVRASMLMPKEEHNARLKKLLPELKRRKAAGGDGPKLLISGCMCEDVLVDILDFVEDLGAVVVDDDVYTGHRYVAVDAPHAADPIEALAQKYLAMIPCPTRYRPDWDWGKYLVDRVKESGARGVVIIAVTHCEPHWYAYPNLRNKLQAAGIPHFYLESEQESLALGRVRTRVEAFMEMVKGGA